jgi:hypothetical protein
MTHTERGEGARIELGSWLAPGLLALLAATDPVGDPDDVRLLLAREEDAEERPVRWLRCPDARPGPPREAWILTVDLRPSRAEISSRSVTLLAGSERRELDLAALESLLVKPKELGAACRVRLNPAGRRQAQAFMSASPSGHQLALTAPLAANLTAMRDELRTPLPTTKFQPGPCAARLEGVTALDELHFWLAGWVHDAAPTQVRFTAVSPEGAVQEIPAGAVTFHPRPAYAATLKDDAAFSTLGYYAYIELDQPSRHRDGWIMEFRTADGRTVEHRVSRPVQTDTGTLRKLLAEQLRTSAPNESAFERQILPARTQLRGDPQDTRIDRVIALGNVPEAPRLSIVVAVRRNDRIEHQLLSFANDPDLEEAELIFVAPPPDDERELVDLVEGLHDLHDVPFLLAIASDQPTRARALNLGASLARGSLLVLMGGDVFPSGQGWIANMRKLVEGSPSVGAVGPKLLYEDNSIANAGIDYVRRSTGGWRRALPFAGLARTIPGANSPRRVQAISDACLLIDRELFDRSGRFSELYLDGGDEGGDLSLRLADDAEVWYAPEAELHLLDEEPPGKHSRGEARFNDWLFDRRCGNRLGAPATEAGAERPAPRAARPAIPVFGSGRPGAPVEILEIETATPDPEVALDASLQLTSAESDSAYGDTYTLALSGWAVPNGNGALTIEVSDGTEVRWTTTADLPRPALGAKFPDEPTAAESGFQFLISSLSLPREFELSVSGISAAGARATLGRIRGRRRALRSAYRPRLQPLLLTTLGRSGSAWLVALLSLHPEIVGLSPFRYEAKLSSYWIDLLHTLGEPASYMQMILPEISDPKWWVGSRQSPLPVGLRDTEMPRWLGCEQVEIMAGFCQSRLDGFYQELAGMQNRTLARCFVEKCYPGPVPGSIAELYPDGREIVLVRDLRDMVCSIDDYNAKRGFALWGRDRAATDEQWFAHLRSEANKLLDCLLTRPDRTHLVRYEDLIAEPERTLTAVFSHAGVDADAGIARMVLDEEMGLAHKEKSFHQTSGSPEASLGRWKRDLSPERRTLCTEMFDDILHEFGYEPTAGGAAAESGALSPSSEPAEA